MRVISIDPSVNNVGYCIFEPHLTGPKANRKKKSWRWGTIKPEGFSLEQKALDICQIIQSELFPWDDKYDGVGEFDFLVTEKPAFYSSEKGQIAAHQNYTIDLAAINYFVAGYFRKDHRTHYSITATAWKGSVPKIITMKKFYRTFGIDPNVPNKKLTDHAIDATMLLHFWLTTYAMVSPLVAPHISPAQLQELL